MGPVERALEWWNGTGSGVFVCAKKWTTFFNGSPEFIRVVNATYVLSVPYEMQKVVALRLKADEYLSQEKYLQAALTIFLIGQKILMSSLSISTTYEAIFGSSLIQNGRFFTLIGYSMEAINQMVSMVHTKPKRFEVIRLVGLIAEIVGLYQQREDPDALLLMAMGSTVKLTCTLG